ncbi:MAG TPA: hypothetical protein PKD98_25625 [Anaerolineae bacterium]|nr:hypothetical protein [Anaerolineae bacterium]
MDKNAESALGRSQPEIEAYRLVQGQIRTMTRYLRLRDGLRLATRSLWSALLGGALIALAARVWPLENRYLWSVLPLLIWFGGVSSYTFLRPLPPLLAARRLDRELGLKDRLATALELHASSPEPGPLAFPARQLADAALTAAQLSPGRLDWRQSRRPLGWAGGLLLIALSLVLLPNPMDAILAQREAIKAAAEAQSKALQEARQELEATTDPTSEARGQALKAMEELIKALADNPGDLEQALADLARTQAALRELQTPASPGQAGNLDHLAAQLARLSRGETTASPGSDQAGPALAELAASLPGLDPAGQADLAAALAELAGQAAAVDPNLAAELHRLAAAVRAGDVAGAVQAAGAAQGALAQAGRETDLREALAVAQASLTDSRQQLAQAGGVAQNPGQNQGQGQGQGSGQGQGQGQGQGGGGGTTADQLPGANRSGAAADPNRPNRPAGLADLNTVFAPAGGPHFAGSPDFVAGREGEQGQVIIRAEQSPQGNLNPALVPYQSVYQTYANAATETMDRERIPSEMQSYVRDYFLQLAPDAGD